MLVGGGRRARGGRWVAWSAIPPVWRLEGGDGLPLSFNNGLEPGFGRELRTFGGGGIGEGKGSKDILVVYLPLRSGNLYWKWNRKWCCWKWWGNWGLSYSSFFSPFLYIFLDRLKKPLATGYFYAFYSPFPLRFPIFVYFVPAFTQFTYPRIWFDRYLILANAHPNRLTMVRHIQICWVRNMGREKGTTSSVGISWKKDFRKFSISPRNSAPIDILNNRSVKRKTSWNEL